MKQRLSPVENNIMNSKQEMFAKLDYTENQYSRTNILIDGIKDDQEETWSESKTVQHSQATGGCVAQILRVSMPRELAHPRKEEKLKKMVVKLRRFKARQWVLLSNKELKRTNK